MSIAPSLTLRNVRIHLKTDCNGNAVRYRARLVAKGFSQRYGVDYEVTYSPVAKKAALRAMIAYAAQNNLDIYHLDVKAAFLHGDLSETIYMEQPPGFVQ